MTEQEKKSAYKDISAEEMAAYFQSALNGDTMKKIINGAPTIFKAEALYQKTAKMLLGYVSATGDLSAQKQKVLLQTFAEHGSEALKPYDERLKSDGAGIYFSKYIVPEIIAYHAKNRPAGEKDGAEALTGLLEAAYAQGHCGSFYTHAFNGALYDEVSRNGLDISKEKFLDEYAVLQEVGLFQPFKKGVLCLADLSEASFGYAQASPERLHRTLEPQSRRGNDETRREYLRRGLEEFLERQDNMPEAEKQKVRTAGRRLADFYTTGEARKSVIAFIKDEKATAKDTQDGSEAVRKSFAFYFGRAMQIKGRRLDWDETLRNQWRDLQDKGFEGVCEFIRTYKAQKPEAVMFDEIIRDAAADTIGNTCLKNFAYGGNADGYGVPGGKIAADKLAFCVFDNPGDAYALEQKTIAKAEKMLENKYKRQCYENVYRAPLLRGVEPAEDFETFCESRPELTHMRREENGVVRPVENPHFSAWKKLRGYDKPNSIASINLHKLAREAVLRKADAADSYGGGYGKAGREA